MSVRLFSKVTVSTQLETFFLLGNFIIVKTYDNFADIDSQLARGMSAIFRYLSYIK